MREPLRRSHFDNASVPNMVREIFARCMEAPGPGQVTAVIEELAYDAAHTISPPEQTMVVAQTFAKSGHDQQARTSPEVPVQRRIGA